MFRKKPKKKNNRGFSLVEVLLAVVLLGLIAAPILQMLYSSYYMNNKSGRMLAASDLAHTISEAISAQTFNSVTSNGKMTYPGIANYYTFPGECTSKDTTPQYVCGVVKSFEEKTTTEGGTVVKQIVPVYEYGPKGDMVTPIKDGNAYVFHFDNVKYPKNNSYIFSVDIKIDPSKRYIDPRDGTVPTSFKVEGGETKTVYDIDNPYYSVGVETSVKYYNSKTGKTETLSTVYTEIPNKR